MRSFCLLFSLTMLAACDTSGGNARTVPQQLVLMLNNVGDGTNPGTVLFVRTEEGYPCAGYTLPLDVMRSGAMVRLRVGGVEEPAGDACATVVVPATGEARLGLGDGTFTLLIESDGRVDRYRLLVQDQRTTLVALDAAYTRVEVYLEG